MKQRDAARAEADRLAGKVVAALACHPQVDTGMGWSYCDTCLESDFDSFAHVRWPCPTAAALAAHDAARP